LSQQAAHVGTFDWDIQTNVNIWTPELEAMYGLRPGEFAKTQSGWEQLIHPDDRDDAVRKVEQSFQTGQPVEGEWRIIWPDGSVRGSQVAGKFSKTNPAAVADDGRQS
jgi:PAS domain-containing protein